jgi:hypothetical protein
VHRHFVFGQRTLARDLWDLGKGEQDWRQSEGYHTAVGGVDDEFGWKVKYLLSRKKDAAACYHRDAACSKAQLQLPGRR